MRILGNVLWMLLGGIIVALFYFIGALVVCLTIIGIPFGWQLMKLGWVSVVPFGKQVIHGEASTGCVAICLNVIWILAGGIWVALTHLVFGILCGVTIVGIPFARQHFKLMAISFAPFGVEIREFGDAAEVRITRRESLPDES